MNSNSNLLKSRYVAPMLVLLALAMSLNNAMAYNRIFALRLYNETASNVTFTITPGTCYQGTGVGYFGPGSATGLVHGPVAPGNYTEILVARNQEGCDGEAGYFGISPSTYPGEGQSFAFSNDGMMSQIAPTPNGFSGDLTSTVYNNNTEIFYTWTLKNIETRLSGPLDERLTMPRNPIAKNFGKWDGDSADGGSTQTDTLEFRKNGFRGFEYHECAGSKQYHTQHIVRMPNKNGHAYFVVANSLAYVPDEPFVSAHSRGTVAIYRTDAAPDPVTDLVPNNPGTDGEIVWEHTFDRGSPIGMWNHPCKMEMIGNLLLVSMQQYTGIGSCRWGDGDEEAVVFYDVRDPENPKYWGKMGAATLGGIHGTPDEVSEVTMSRQGDMWILNAGAWEGPGYQANLFSTKKVGPNIGDWTRFGWESSGGPHGGAFNSFEIYDAPATPPLGIDIPGQERTMFADGGCDNGCPNDSFPWVNPSGDNHVVGDEFLEFSTMIRTPTSVPKTNRLYYPAPNLFPSNNDYDACGPYVTRRGMVVMYAPLEHYPDAAGGDFSADKIYQVWHPANLALETPHPDQVVTTLADDGIGSLRRAIGYGGRITFAPSLNNGTIVLENGPLFVYPYDVNIDASSLPFGISIQGQNFETRALIQVMDPNTLTMSSGLRTMGDPLTSALQNPGTSTSIPWATGGAESWFPEYSIFSDGSSPAAQSGVIKNSQATYLQSSVSGPAILTFWWKVSSEANFDFLRFTMDGVETAAAPAISGEVSWVKKTVTLPAGSHTLRWTYSKDSSSTGGSDAAWLDQVDLTRLRGEIAFELPVGTPLNIGATVDFGKQLSGGPWMPKTFTIKNTNTVDIPLNISGVTFLGGPSPDFTINTAGMLTSIPAAGQTTFTVTFNPGSLGLRTAALVVNSDDLGEGTSIFVLNGTGVAVAPPSLPVALDAPTLVWTSSGNSLWSGQTDTTHDGVDAAQSGPLGDIDEGYLETTVTGPGTLTFWWKVSSQENFNFLGFFMTGVGTTTGFAITGEVDWQQRTVIVPTGSTTLRWTYRKTAENFAGLDAGWLDQVVFTPVPVITSPLTASGTLGEPFNYQIAASNTPTSYNATGLPAGVTVATSTGLISGTPTVGGNFTVTLTATNAGGSGTATLTLNIATLPPALDTTGLVWTSGGGANWFGQTVTTHDGVDAAQSGNIEDSGDIEWSFMETTVTGPGTLTFWWKVSSEAGGDFLRFRFIGQGDAVPAISGEVDWAQKTVPVPAGAHTLSWAYSKNESVSAGSDAGWLDQVVFTPSQPEIAIELPLGTLAVGGVVAWGENGNGQTTVPLAAHSGVIGIAAGYVHTAALKTDGTVVAWGSNGYGETNVPVDLNGVVAIAGTRFHTAALKSNGTVRTWGYGTETTVPPGLNDVRAIAAGFAFTVALKNDGSVVAWGNNSHGQATVPAAALSGVIAIAANDLHALALKSDGSVIAWGNPANGRTTVPVAALSGVIAIAAGGNHSLALKSDGTVVAWGQSSEGQTTVPAGLSGVVAIAAGDFNTEAIKSDGSVVAWGYPDFGVNTVPVAALSNALAIAGGGNHAVALVGTRIVDFGSQPIGAAGATKTFTIKNTGSAALNITSVTTESFIGDFLVYTSGMLTSIPSNGQTTFQVTFFPWILGPHTAILHVHSDDADEGISDITLTGTGSTSVVSLQFGVPGAGTNTLTYAGIPGYPYIAQYATNLSTSPWFDFRTNAAGTNGLWQVIDVTATNAQRFYRVRTP